LNYTVEPKCTAELIDTEELTYQSHKYTLWPFNHYTRRDGQELCASWWGILVNYQIKVSKKQADTCQTGNYYILFLKICVAI